MCCRHKVKTGSGSGDVSQPALQITCEMNKRKQQEMEEIPLTTVAEFFKLCRILPSTVSYATTVKSDI